MRFYQCFLLLLYMVGVSIDVQAQVPRVWIKAPGALSTPMSPGTMTPAMFEIERRLPTGMSIPFGPKVPPLRISNLYDIGSAVSSPPDRNILMILQPNGYLGMGTGNPISLLNLNVSGNDFRQLLTFSYIDDNIKWDYSSFGLEGSSAFWVNNAQLRKGVGGTDRWFIDRGSFKASSSRIMHGWDGIYFHYYNHDSNTQGARTHDWRPFTTAWKQSMQITNGGQIRIGEKTIIDGAHSDYKLSVDGKAVFKEAVVTLTSWADYVFDENYSLKPLFEVETYIVENKKLPNFPSVTEIINEGMNVGDITILQQEKIEELFLYIIELEKEVQVLRKDLSEIKSHNHD